MKNINFGLGIAIIFILSAVVTAYTFYELELTNSYSANFFTNVFKHVTGTTDIGDIKKFSSEDDFKNYLEKSKEYRSYGADGAEKTLMKGEIAMTYTMTNDSAGATGEMTQGRFSETNVQVAGIDEPDIVKTDGKEIYFSREGYYYWDQFNFETAKMIMPPQNNGGTSLIKAFPPADLALDVKIGQNGQLLLSKNILVIFNGEKIYGYDVSDSKSPKEKWNVELKEQNYVIGARLYNEKIYLTTKKRINNNNPCYLEPLSFNGKSLKISCLDIYRPTIDIPADVIFTAFIINAKSGNVENNVSFVGSSESSIFYMSENAIYITYPFYQDLVKFTYNFFNEKWKDLISALTLNKIKKLIDYDISPASKMTELGIITERFLNSLDNDEKLRVENELQNRMADYYKNNIRDLQGTGLVKIGLDKFEISANGSIPGTLLNQFSLDEYKGNLRAATTIGEGYFGMFSGFSGSRETINDVYVLDKDLNITGSVKDLGIQEKIYSVRFLEDKGYVVTFRETDPFYVLDLFDPNKPELAGELKIPGYSAYLHPITKDKILGIGREGSQVKISLFDVKDPEKPTEKSKYVLNEYWSEILDNHHAFLMDEKQEVFFLPGSQGGYIFSYKGDQLKLVKAVSDISAKRAIYINDYLYIIGDNKIVVLNEIDWTRVSKLDL
ncbi:hypothetical protein BWK69_01000 [Candidatus Parcubacteria bacterium A4]|nr:MAG: hypothetical protein BWK69_01000 [Candidatus Parcubacteria bacterium A4]